MWDVKYLVKDFPRSKSLQEFINRRFKDENKAIIDKEYVAYIVMKSGDLFYVSEDLGTVTSIHKEYIFDDIRRNDIVIDI